MRGRVHHVLLGSGFHGSIGGIRISDGVTLGFNDGHDVTAPRGRKFRTVEGYDDGKLFLVDLAVDEGPGVGRNVAGIAPIVSGRAAFRLESVKEAESISGVDVHVGEISSGEGVETHSHTGLTTGDIVALGHRFHGRSGTCGIVEARNSGQIEVTHIVQLKLGGVLSTKVCFRNLRLGMSGHKLVEGRRVDLRTLLNSLLDLADSILYAIYFAQDELSLGTV